MRTVAKIHTLGNETSGDTILPMKVREECMLGICEKQPLRATSKMVHCKHLTIVLALLCVPPIGTLAQKADTAQNPPAPLGKLVDVGGYRVHLYCTGTGSPTVVIVGAGFSFNWGLVQREVAKVAQVCSYDHSGIGWSDSNRGAQVLEVPYVLQVVRVGQPEEVHRGDGHLFLRTEEH